MGGKIELYHSSPPIHQRAPSLELSMASLVILLSSSLPGIKYTGTIILRRCLSVRSCEFWLFLLAFGCDFALPHLWSYLTCWICLPAWFMVFLPVYPLWFWYWTFWSFGFVSYCFGDDCFCPERCFYIRPVNNLLQTDLYTVSVSPLLHQYSPFHMLIPVVALLDQMAQQKSVWGKIDVWNILYITLTKTQLRGQTGQSLKNFNCQIWAAWWLTGFSGSRSWVRACAWNIVRVDGPMFSPGLPGFLQLLYRRAALCLLLST